MATRNELVEAIAARYAQGTRSEKARILDEFVAVTDFHRKRAMRLLRGGAPAEPSGQRPSRRVYDDAVREALLVMWEASDRICSKRLKELIPILLDAMDRHGHLDLSPQVRSKLLRISSHDRPGVACGPEEDRATRAPSSGDLGRPAERPGTDLLRLGGSVTRVHGSGSGGPQRSDGARQLHPDAGPDRHRHRLDGMPAAASTTAGTS